MSIKKIFNERNTKIIQESETPMDPKDISDLIERELGIKPEDYSLIGDKLVFKKDIISLKTGISKTIKYPIQSANNFSIRDDDIVSLKNTPIIVQGTLELSILKNLKTLKGISTKKTVSLRIEKLPIHNLDGIQDLEIFKGHLILSDCDKLTSLHGLNRNNRDAIKVVVTSCKSLHRIDNLPQYLSGMQLTGLTNVEFDFSGVKAFHGILSIHNTTVKSGLVKLLQFEDFDGFNCFSDNEDDVIRACRILNKYVKHHDKHEAVVNAIDELIDNGLEQYANV